MGSYAAPSIGSAHEKLQSGEYRSAEEVINAAMRLLQQHDEDRQVLLRVNAGEALPVDERFDARLEMLLQEAEDSGEPSEMTAQDWDDIRQQGLALIKSRKSLWPASACQTSMTW